MNRIKLTFKDYLQLILTTIAVLAALSSTFGFYYNLDKKQEVMSAEQQNTREDINEIYKVLEYLKDELDKDNHKQDEQSYRFQQETKEQLTRVEAQVREVSLSTAAIKSRLKIN